MTLSHLAATSLAAHRLLAAKTSLLMRGGSNRVAFSSPRLRVSSPRKLLPKAKNLPAATTRLCLLQASY